MHIYNLYINVMPGLAMDGYILAGAFTTMGGEQPVINFIERKFGVTVESIILNATEDDSVLYSFEIKVSDKKDDGRIINMKWTGYVADTIIDEW